jgi:hypothetical protein
MEYNGIEGLGDVIERIAKRTGAKAIVKAVNGGKECSGCDKRRKKLNKKFPIR